MRVGIDVRYLSHGIAGGVHAHVSHLVPALLRAAPEHEFFLYADTKRRFELIDLPDNAALRLLPYRNPLDSVYLDLSLRRQMAGDRLDVAHFPANVGLGPARARTVLTLHDAINVLPYREILRGHRHDLRTVAMMTYLHLMSVASVRRADTLVTVSEVARLDIAGRTGFDPGRIRVVPNAPSPSLRRVEDPIALSSTRARLGLPDSFVLADAVKSPDRLLAAWRLLPADLRASRRIVFFSRRSDPSPCVGDAVARGLATLLVRPSSTDLAALYSMADAFAFPSFYEGFGLPPLEAMTCGAPVVASNRGAIPEVVGDAALLFDHEDTATFACHLAVVLGQPAVAADLRTRGFARARRFTWELSAQRVIECYGLIAGR